MKRSNLSKEKYTIYSLRRKKALGSIMELSPVVKEIRLKENPYIKSNKGRGGISQRTHPSKLQTHEKQLKINQGNKLPKREN